MNEPLVLALIFLAAMVLTVPLAKKLGLGAVLGYLVAGALLGPGALGVLGHSQGEILHFAEFGVIMMLFLIGLELKPSVLWKLRGPIFGLGGLQVSITLAAVMSLALLAGFAWQTALVVGMIFSLSSTAIVLQSLREAGALKTTGGETSFAVLLFQDVAVIPMLAILPLLGVAHVEGAHGAASAGPGWMQALKIAAAITSVIVTGRYLIRPIFSMVAKARLREIFTAMALLIVLGITMLMNLVGLSPALGAFLAGVVLADSEYRHQLETDIEPFKGLLLGVFFISVGAGIEFGQLRESPGFIAAAVATLIFLKFGVLYLVGRIGRLPTPEALLFSFSLAQGGEFAFVLLNLARGGGVFDPSTTQALTASVAISMFFAPLLITAYFKYVQPHYSGCYKMEERDSDEIDPEERENPVIVAGFGRFGQMVVRLLKASGIKSTVLDFDAEQVEIMRGFGQKSYYGDASNMDLLRSAGAPHAKLLIVGIDDQAKALEIIDNVKKEFPHLKILARAYDRLAAYEMIHRGVKHPYIETAGSALNVGIAALRELGMPAHQAYRAGVAFNRFNDNSIQELAKAYHEMDEASYLAQIRKFASALEDVLKTDVQKLEPHEFDEGWESPPRAKSQQEPQT